MAIVVNAFNGMLAAWPFTHIGEERDEARTPAFANFNASTAIVSVNRTSSIRASLNDVRPGHVFRSFR